MKTVAEYDAWIEHNISGRTVPHRRDLKRTYLKGRNLTAVFPVPVIHVRCIDYRTIVFGANCGHQLILGLVKKEHRGLPLAPGTDQIGISKDFNIFELQDAFTLGDPIMLERIMDHLASSMKGKSVLPVTGSLYTFFSKVYGLYSPDVPAHEVVGLKIPFVIKQYEKAKTVFSQSSLERIFVLLQEYEMRSKGVEDGRYDEKALLQELLFKIYNLRSERAKRQRFNTLK